MDYSDLKVGVLALQGAVSEHLRQLEKLGAMGVQVKNPAQLRELDGLILPGGESTAMAKLMAEQGFVEAIRAFSASQKPIFGTCAGMILLAEKLEGGEAPHLGLMAIRVRRNAYGRQTDSFQTQLAVKGLAAPVSAVFIRAPYIAAADESAVEILAEFGGNPVLARQRHLLACAFHPELTEDTALMGLFLDSVKQAKDRAQGAK